MCFSMVGKQTKLATQCFRIFDSNRKKRWTSHAMVSEEGDSIDLM